MSGRIYALRSARCSHSKKHSATNLRSGRKGSLRIFFERAVLARTREALLGLTVFALSDIIGSFTGQEIFCSIPACVNPTCRKQAGDVVQLVRTLPCHGRGREFESRRPRQLFSPEKILLFSIRFCSRSFDYAQDFGSGLPLALTPAKRLKFESRRPRQLSRLKKSFYSRYDSVADPSTTLRISAAGSR